MVGFNQDPQGREPARDSGSHERRTVDRDAFHSLAVGGAVLVTVRRGEEQRITAEGPSIMLDDLQILSVDGRAQVGWRDGASWPHNGNGQGVDIEIVVPAISTIRQSGPARISVERIEGEEVSIIAGDAGRLKVAAIDSPSAKIVKSGAGNLEIGEVRSDDLTIGKDGAGSLVVDRIEARQLKAVVDGAGPVRLSGRTGEGVIVKSGAGTLEASGLAGKVDYR